MLDAELCSIGQNLRVGVHAGPCEVYGDDIIGLAVNIAAAIGSRGDPETDDHAQHAQPVPDDQDDNSTAEEIVLGVDTHQDRPAAALLSALGVLLSSNDFPVTAAGHRALLAWAGTFGMLLRAGVECTGSSGAALAHHLRAAGVEVIEVNAPDKATRRRQGNADPFDAQAAARAVLERPGQRDGQGR